MARIDGSLADPTPTGEIADRADTWRIAAALLRGAGMAAEAQPDDVLELARFLSGE